MPHHIRPRRSAFSARTLGLVVAAALLTACGSNPGSAQPAAHTPTTSGVAEAASSAGAPPTKRAGIAPGIIVATCDEPTTAGTTLTVSSYQDNGTRNDTASKFQLPLAGSTGPQPSITCMQLGTTPDVVAENGVRLRDAFDRTFTRVLASEHDTATQDQAVGWLNTSGEFTALSPSTTPGDLITVTDEYPMYHAATDRVYYWHTTKNASVLMSCSPDGKDSRSEDTLAKAYEFEGLSSTGVGGLPGRARAYLPNTTAPILTIGRLANRAGTIGAVITPTPGLVFAPPTQLGKYDLATDGGLPFTGDVPQGTLVQLGLDTFVTDTTLIVHADGQLYRIDASDGKTARSTLLFGNDKLAISDVTASPDGRTLAFLGRGEAETALYAVPVSGGNPTKLATVNRTTAILQYGG